MASLVFDTLEILFAGGLIDDVADFLVNLMSAMTSIFTLDAIGGMINVFIAIAGSLMTIFLFVDVMDKATKDMITLERLILILVKYFIAMLILIYLKEIISTLFNLASGIYDMAKDNWLGRGSAYGLEFFPDDGNPDPSVWPDYDSVKDALVDAGYGDSKLSMLTKPGTMIFCFLTLAITFIARLAAYFIAVGNSVMLIARTAFSPLGVVQLFDEGQRSSGIRYLKKLAAEALTFAVIVGILYASSLLQSNLLGTILGDVLNGAVSVDIIPEVFEWGNLACIIIIQLAAVGGMFKAGQLAKEIVGA